MAGLRLTDQRSLALLAILCVFRLLPHGFTNTNLRRHLAPLLGKTPGLMTSGQITYDLQAAAPARAHQTHPAHLPLSGHRHRACAQLSSSPAFTTGSCAPA